MNQILLLFFCLAAFSVTAQSVAIKKIEVAGDDIVVHYDLDDSNPNNEYQLSLFASRDNFASALTKVTGDIGSEVKPGTDKKVRWNAREELGNYKGRLSLEIRGKVFIPFVKLQNLETKQGFKRGTSRALSWKPGNTNPINVELFKGGQRVDGAMNIPNNGGHPFYFPSHAKPGDDYRLRFTDTKNPDDVVYSPAFKVKPKLPFLLKVLPIAAVAGGLVFLAGQGGGGDTGGGTQPGDSTIPLPPGPGGN